MESRKPNGQTEVASKLYSGSSVYLIVPADAQLESSARECLKSEQLHRRLEAANAFRHFNSDENAELLKSLLTDKGFYTVRQKNTPPKRFYAVRKMAYEVLTSWGVKVDRPAIEQE